MEKDSHYANYPDSYTNNKRLMAIVKKHDDPIKFLLDVMTQLNTGKLKLRIVGASSTREVAALWNDHKNKKIPTKMVENFNEEHYK